MSEEMTTEDVFGPEVKGKPKEEPVEKPEPIEAKQEPEADEPKEPEAKGQPEPGQQGTGVEPPSPGEAKLPDGHVPISAMEGERKRRQEAERRYEELQRQLKEREAKEQKVPPEFRQDPEGYLRHMQEQFQSTIQQQTVVQSQQLMRSLHPDYDEMENYLVGRAEADPALGAQIAAGLQQSQNPAKYAYDKAKELKWLEEVDAAGGRDAWREAETRRIREQLQAELQAKQPQPNPEVDAPPESLAAAPSTVSPKETFKKPSTTEIFN